MMHLSLNCREHQGQANRLHQCVRCDCSCHAVGPPANFRDLVKRAQESAEEDRLKENA